MAFRVVGKEEKEVSLECVHISAEGVKAGKSGSSDPGTDNDNMLR